MTQQATTTKLTVRLEHDHDIECPADEECAWKLYSFCTRHTSFKHPDELKFGPPDENGDPKIGDAKLRQKLKSGLAFILSYFEHGNSIWFRKGNAPAGVEFQWDGTRIAGLLVWEHPADHMGAKTYEDRAEDADGFLREYTAWANGEGFYFSIETEDGKDVDSCGGFRGSDYMLDEISTQLVGHDFEVQGDADYLEDDLRARVRKAEEEKSQ